MKIYYVDAENVGIDILKEKNISILDKVFVFSNNESIKAECEQRLYTCISGYPLGKNQADFYMVAHLQRLISQLTNKDRGAIALMFCSKDQDLLKALGDQCAKASVKKNCLYSEVNNITLNP